MKILLATLISANQEIINQVEWTKEECKEGIENTYWRWLTCTACPAKRYTENANKQAYDIGQKFLGACQLLAWCAIHKIFFLWTDHIYQGFYGKSCWIYFVKHYLKMNKKRKKFTHTACQTHDPYHILSSAHEDSNNACGPNIAANTPSLHIGRFFATQLSHTNFYALPRCCS